MKKLLTSLLFAFLYINTLSAQTVYISENGKKFHKKNCSIVSTGKKGIDIKQAQKMGYEACKICKPEGDWLDDKKNKSSAPKKK
jgi:methylphosphotriester-DNA--protein-cysteine methyltransferase